MSEAYRLKNQARQSADWLLDDDGTPLGLVGPNGDLLIPLLSQTNELTGEVEITAGGEPVSVGGGTSVAAPSTSIVLDADRLYQPLVIAGATAITVSGDSAGKSSSMIVIADGENVPSVSGADEWATSFGYLNTAGIPNRLDAWYDGVARRYAWSQQMTPVAIDLLAPSVSAITVNGATLIITYSETINATAPAASAYSVSGAGGVTQTPTGVTISDAAVTLTLATAAETGNTVTISYTPPASNPISDAAGNLAATLSAAAVTNNTGATFGGDVLALTSLNNITASDDDYTGDAGTTGWQAYGRPGSQKIPANGDGYIGVAWESASNSSVALGLSPTANPTHITGLAYYMVLSSTSGNITRGAVSAVGVVSTAVEALGTPGPLMMYRIGRVGAFQKLEKSTDGGHNWADMANVATGNTGELYPVIFTAANHSFHNPRSWGVA